MKSSSLGPRMLCAAALAAAAALTVPVPAPALADGAWLDAPQIARWNVPGSPVPPAPPRDPAVQQRCFEQERPASGAEEQQAAAAGWRLEQYWPAQRRGDLAVVTATANFDGMCRPWGFNVLVFSGGRFAGTLSPVNMNSREDGVLRRTPQLLSDGRIQADFTRYAPADPLCCPSRGYSQVVYRIDQTAGGPLVVPERVSAMAPGGAPVQAPVQMPAQLPNTGDGTPRPVAAGIAGVLLMLLGAVAWLLPRWGASRDGQTS